MTSTKRTAFFFSLLRSWLITSKETSCLTQATTACHSLQATQTTSSLTTATSLLTVRMQLRTSASFKSRIMWQRLSTLIRCTRKRWSWSRRTSTWPRTKSKRRSRWTILMAICSMSAKSRPSRFSRMISFSKRYKSQSLQRTTSSSVAWSRTSATLWCRWELSTCRRFNQS